MGGSFLPLRRPEHAARRPGSQEILARLSEMLFVEAVQGYIDSLHGDATGWLAALRDPSLSRALIVSQDQFSAQGGQEMGSPAAVQIPVTTNTWLL
jgi:hypothetical protein